MDGAEEDPSGTLEPQVGVGCAILVVQHVRLLRSSGERAQYKQEFQRGRICIAYSSAKQCSERLQLEF